MENKSGNGNVPLISKIAYGFGDVGCIFAACFQPVFRKLNNKGRTASIFACLTGVSMISMFFFSVKDAPIVFYALSGITQFFFSGFNTAIYAIIPDCVEYGEWKTGLRNDGFQYAFISLGNLIEDKNFFTTLAFVEIKENGEREFSFARKPGADTQLREDELDKKLLGDCRRFILGWLYK